MQKSPDRKKVVPSSAGPDLETIFFISTPTGIVGIPYLAKWTSYGRVLVLHEGADEKYAVSDFATGRLFCSGRTKTAVKKLAEQLLQEHENFNWDQYPNINHNEYLAGWAAAQQFTGLYLTGIIDGLKARDLM